MAYVAGNLLFCFNGLRGRGIYSSALMACVAGESALMACVAGESILLL